MEITGTRVQPARASRIKEVMMPQEPDEEFARPASDERKAEARGNLRKRFPEITDEDFDTVSRETTKTGKLEVFLQRMMERYKWSRGACQQQLGQGMDDIRDC
jgi:hypothetical protein